MPLISSTPFRKGNIEPTEHAALEPRPAPLNANPNTVDGFDGTANEAWHGFCNAPRGEPSSGAGWTKELQDEFHYVQHIRNELNGNGITTVSASGEMPALTSSEQLNLVRQLIVDSEKPLYFFVMVDGEIKAYSDKAEWLQAVGDQLQGTLPPSIMGAKSEKEAQLAIIDKALTPVVWATVEKKREINK